MHLRQNAPWPFYSDDSNYIIMYERVNIGNLFYFTDLVPPI